MKKEKISMGQCMAEMDYDFWIMIGFDLLCILILLTVATSPWWYVKFWIGI